MQQFYTAESVARGHPDKLCDQIADAILDDCLTNDHNARVACEVLATKGHIVIAGEITCTHLPQVEQTARAILTEIGYDPGKFAIANLIHPQSEDIAKGIAHSLESRHGRQPSGIGAGDQGIVVGYACDETWQYLPLPVVLARRLTQRLDEARLSGELPFLGPDGKAQVTVEYDQEGRPSRIDAVVLSAQHSGEIPQDELFFELTDKVVGPALTALPPDEHTQLLLNPAGRFVTGGPDADTGLTGRKLSVDTYSVFAPHGGGSFSGKDPTKVDRSGAYMARYIAKNLVAAGLCKRCQVTLAYAIGREHPVMVEVDTFSTGRYCSDDCLTGAVQLLFGLTPGEILHELDLLTPRYLRAAAYGHFGHRDFPWERTDKVKELRSALL